MSTIQKYFFMIAGWLFIYFYPAFEFILLVGFFVLMDTITGVIAAKKRGEIITSKKLRSVFPKYIIYGVSILVAHVVQQQFFPDFPALKLIAGFVAYVELKSIDENIKDATGVSLFKSVITKLKR